MKTKEKSTEMVVQIQGIVLPHDLRNKLENDISHVVNKFLTELDAVYRHDMIRRVHELDIQPPLSKDFKYGIWVGVNNHDFLKEVAYKHELKNDLP